MEVVLGEWKMQITRQPAAQQQGENRPKHKEPPHRRGQGNGARLKEEQSTTKETSNPAEDQRRARTKTGRSLPCGGGGGCAPAAARLVSPAELKIETETLDDDSDDKEAQF